MITTLRTIRWTALGLIVVAALGMGSISISGVTRRFTRQDYRLFPSVRPDHPRGLDALQ